MQGVKADISSNKKYFHSAYGLMFDITATEFVNYVMFIPKSLINCGLFVFAILQRIVLESHCFQGLRICLSNIPT